MDKNYTFQNQISIIIDFYIKKIIWLHFMQNIKQLSTHKIQSNQRQTNVQFPALSFL